MDMLWCTLDGSAFKASLCA
ncbi:unnamed protein product [Phytomonas sp. EM1]|nr:unnamed protein product [Phytomonas sp. EM1]|eukprot:CCW62117.1 unnamed protein product [Phytomonas sp. isolate EM1]